MAHPLTRGQPAWAVRGSDEQAQQLAEVMDIDHDGHVCFNGQSRPTGRVATCRLELGSVHACTHRDAHARVFVCVCLQTLPSRSAWSKLARSRF